MSFFSTKTIGRTRKPHSCDVCPVQIEVGSRAFYWAGLIEGDFYTGHYHEDCREAEEAWNNRNGSRWDEYEILCAIRDSDEADKDIPWLIETFPAVAARMGLVV